MKTLKKSDSGFKKDATYSFAKSPKGKKYKTEGSGFKKAPAKS